MALYHVHVKNISRADGATALAASAYRAGARLVHDATGQRWDYRRKPGIVFSRILLPNGAPDWMTDRARLWNAVEARERRKDARLAKEIEIALPRELSRSQQIDLALSYGDMLRAKGLVVDVAVHDPQEGHNPHVHLLVTTRAIIGEGFGGKLRDLDNVAFIHEIRVRWTEYGNAALAAAGKRGDLDHRSYAARGIARIPQKHRLRRWTRERARRRERMERQHRLAQYRQRFSDYARSEAIFVPPVVPVVERRETPIEERRVGASPSAVERDSATITSLERTIMASTDMPTGTQAPREAEQGIHAADPRYPLLSQRPDWPPQTHVPARDMSGPERVELVRFFQDKRQEELLTEVRPELEEYRRDSVREIIKAEKAEREGEQARTRGQPRAEVTLDSVTLDERDLAAMEEVWTIDARDPVPDPDGNPISPSQRDLAEEQRLDARPERDSPRPHALSQQEREEAQKRLLDEHERDAWER